MRIISLLSILALLLSSCSDPTQRNEANSHYQTGMKHREDKRYDEAVMAFELCIEQSPRSEKAHLQLAMIAEDHLNDPFKAVQHYRAFIQIGTDEAQAKLAKEWLARAERRLRDELNQKYPMTAPGPLIPIAGTTRQPVQPPAQTVSRATAPVVRGASPAPRPTTPPRPKPTAAPAAAARQQSLYTVKSGDTLQAIAKRTLGSASKWESIYNANRDSLPAPNKLQIGQTIVIPKN